jgi:hypothetical protein
MVLNSENNGYVDIEIMGGIRKIPKKYISISTKNEPNKIGERIKESRSFSILKKSTTAKSKSFDDTLKKESEKDSIEEDRRRGILLYDYFDENVYLNHEELVYIISENDDGWSQIEFEKSIYNIPTVYYSEIDSGFIESLTEEEKYKREIKIKRKKLEIKDYNSKIEEFYRSEDDLSVNNEYDFFIVEENDLEYDEDMSIKSIKPERIYEVLSMNESQEKFVDELLTCLKVTIPTDKFIQKLFEIYLIKPNGSDMKSNDSKKKFISQKLIPIRTRISNIFVKLFQNHFYYFDYSLLSSIADILRVMTKTKNDLNCVSILQVFFDKQVIFNLKKGILEK